MSRIKHVENTKKMQNNIIKIAQTIAENEGWHAVTMRRLCKEVGYTLPVLYHYFKSKEDIIICVANIGFSELLKSFQQIKKVKNIKQTLLLYFKVYLEFATSHPALYTAMYGEYGVSSFTSQNPSEGEKLFFAMQNEFETLFQNQAKRKNQSKKTEGKKERNETKIISSWVATKTVWSMLHGLVDLHFLKRIEGPDTSLNDILEMYAEMILAGWKIDFE